jgi:ribosomal protein S19
MLSYKNKKGPFIKENLINKQNKIIKIINKNFVILPEYLDYIFNIYNGKTFIKLKITKEMVGYKFGEFINTRKKNIYKKK